MKPLIDADLLVYEAAFACEGKPVDDVLEILMYRIEEICEKVGATEPPLLFLTGKDNFRHKIAKQKEYKGNRKQAKPFHYNNARALLRGRWNAQVVDGMEADDMLSVTQMDALLKDLPTIICSRDKDLRQVPGWHYSWETWNSGEKKPEYIDPVGYLTLDKSKKTPKLLGGGYKFFAAQVLMGDSTDNIPGMEKIGPVNAYNYLKDIEEIAQCDEALKYIFWEMYGEGYQPLLEEQINLVWMIRELKDGKPVLWNGEVYNVH